MTVNPNSAVFSTAYFGSIPYFKAMIDGGSPVLFDVYERYAKQSQRNRMTILSGNGTLNLTIPVNRLKGNDSTMKEVQISYAENWQKDHWKSLESAYENSPYFEHYAEDIAAIICSKELYLIDLNQRTFEFILNALALPISWKTTDASPDFSGKHDPRFLYNQKKLEGVLFEPYTQVFSDTKKQFYPHLSILDLLFNQGPMARTWLVT
jgi:hypothetical protein